MSELPYEFRRIPIALIDEPAIIARLEMDDQKLDELAVDIRARGLIQPISVLQRGDRYEVIAGHRRRIASGRAGLLDVPCFVYSSIGDYTEGIKYAENAFREDMSPADEAFYFDELLEKRCGGDIEKVAGLVGRSVAFIDNRLELFRGDPDVFAALRARSIPIGVARELNKITDSKYRHYYLTHAIASGATVATAVAWHTEWKRCIADVPPQAPAPADATPSTPIASHDFYKCVICGKSDPRFLPEQIQVHQHCRLAILEPLLEQARGGEAAGD